MRIRDEGDMQAAFSKMLRSPVGAEWLRSLARACSMPAAAAAFELKVARMWRRGVAGLRFGQMEEHQEVALARACGASGVPLVHKISDSAIGAKPFDCFAMIAAGAYVVAGYVRTEDGASWAAYAIPWSVWVSLKAKKGGRGSVSEQEAASVGVAVPLGE